MIFRQLFDPQSSTYTYLLADERTRHALLVDPVFEQARRDTALIEELGLKLQWTLETHVHADHVTGAWLLRDRLGSRIGLSAASGADGADRLLRHCDPAKVATYAYVNPVVAVLLGTFFAGETVTARMFVAAVLIIGSVAVIITAQQRRARVEPALSAAMPTMLGPSFMVRS